MQTVKPSAGNLFDVSAAAVRKLEHLAFTLGSIVDEIRALTVRQLTASQRVLVVAELKSLDGLDPTSKALDGSLARLRRLAADIEDRGATNANGR